MKKNKRLQTLLLILVVAIWGTLVVQFFNYSGADNEMMYSNNSMPTLLIDNSGVKDSFAIFANYKDPFLGKSMTRSRVNSKPTVNVNRPPVIPSKKKKVIFPSIVYKGYSINNNQVTRVSLSIDGKTKSYKTFQSDGAFKLLSMHKDSVVISWKDQLKTIHRK